MIKSINNRVAVEPVETSVEKVTKNGLVRVAQKVGLVKTTVVFGDGELYEGQGVWVRGDVVSLPYAKEVYEVEGRKFILMPKDAIQLVEAPEPQPYTISYPMQDLDFTESDSYKVRLREGLRELSRLSQECGGYDNETNNKPEGK